ncbi:hypothetical protein MPTK1_1g18840 [Marchantia polymorpha subsp. ruderalis]|uniref:Uncharacterized protein n=2 Tax=Marchantia polymorpha TaxID=3197 RepID=A0AAF6ARP5_MARPO|nr:hypothetical protein MARPO_0001s0222 [Marchantia polymorpha]BBM99115.1 hypothetical protein Mp_1g18840 [Marchantia polymorpha subsp. ruderalis]|eukprot:PTQ50192.1 hypothetical protein MARPO_0001s0222 [Marchantia polymorpha]
MIKIKLPRAMEPPREISPPKSKSRSRTSASAAPAPAPANPKASKDLTPVKLKVQVVTKRRSAPSSQQRKHQQQMPRDEKFIPTSATITTCHVRERLSRPPGMKVLKPSSRKRVPEPESDDEDDEDLEPEFSVSDEEREVVIKNARKRLEELLAETTFLVDELEKMEDDVQRLQDEKVALLEELLACEGLAVNPYPPYRPLTRKIKLVRTKL